MEQLMSIQDYKENYKTKLEEKIKETINDLTISELKNIINIIP